MDQKYLCEKAVELIVDRIKQDKECYVDKVGTFYVDYHSNQGKKKVSAVWFKPDDDLKKVLEDDERISFTPSKKLIEMLEE